MCTIRLPCCRRPHLGCHQSPFTIDNFTYGWPIHREFSSTIMSSLPLPPDAERIPEDTYHPTMSDAVQQAYQRGVDVTPFPALIDVKQLADPVQWLIVFSTVKENACRTCLRDHVLCVLHNGSSYRCLRCLLRNGHPCSHQIGKAVSTPVDSPGSSH